MKQGLWFAGIRVHLTSISRSQRRNFASRYRHSGFAFTDKIIERVAKPPVFAIYGDEIILVRNLPMEEGVEPALRESINS
ncbi:hypothetical protein V5E97_01795 [Singulisphaera sp. Ch08]|uniref:Uncharacterized protein n=1 Tax=Singulisphaera sp. Ch08 TaxID=3120278 RepID=A0AAU7CIA9_9BACT